jgi:hypothetical protein
MRCSAVIVIGMKGIYATSEIRSDVEKQVLLVVGLELEYTQSKSA